MRTFLLLEHVENSLGVGTTEQSLKSISSYYLRLEEAELIAISSRMARQKGPLELYIHTAYIQSRKGVEAFNTLLEAQMVSVECLEVTQPIGSESWGALTEALTAEEQQGVVENISISRLGLGGAMDYMRGLWDAVGDGVVVFCPDSRIWDISISKSDHMWYYAEQQLQRISTMTQDQFIAFVLLCEATESEEDDDAEEAEGDGESEEDEEDSEEDNSEEEGGVDEDEDGQEEDHFGGEGDHGAV